MQTRLQLFQVIRTQLGTPSFLNLNHVRTASEILAARRRVHGKKKPQPSLPLLLRERQLQARMRIRRAKLAAAMKPVLSRRQNLLQHRVNVFIGVERGAGGSSVKVGERGEGRTLSYVQVASIC